MLLLRYTTCPNPQPRMVLEREPLEAVARWAEKQPLDLDPATPVDVYEFEQWYNDATGQSTLWPTGSVLHFTVEDLL